MMNSFIDLQRTNTILYCRSWSETVHFYKQQLGMPISFENEWFVEFKLTDASFLSIANSARATISPVEGQGITLTWEVGDLEEVKKRLTLQDVATSPIQRKWGALAFYCYDPEGHRLEFWTDQPRLADGMDE